MLVSMLRRLVTRVGDEGWSVLQLARAGLLRPVSPVQLAAILRAVRDYGELGAAVTLAVVRHRDAVGLIDERGALTFGDLDARSNAVANEWRRAGLQPGSTVAILARNHRGLLDALFAGMKTGARVVLLNTDFGRTQISDVLAREGADLLVYDEEYADAVADVDVRRGCVRAWADRPGSDTLDEQIRRGDPSPPPAPGVKPSIVILTSGTTGTPKGASRSVPRSLLPLAGLLDKAPFRTGEVTVCCPPMFHSLGFGHLMIAMILGSTLVVRRRFDPEWALESIARHRASALIVVPIMLRRILDLGPQARMDSALRIIFVAGSQLGAELCTRAMEAFGPVVYNLYGSTEVAYGTVATPEDLAEEPGCVGRLVRGAVVKIFDDDGHQVPTGTTGRIFVANSMQFEGYTGGGTKETIRGLMSSGDVGHFDSAGRLFIDGRDDEMIVSGGENVFPCEVEDVLASHPDVLDAAVIGAPDDEYGQRLRGFVVVRSNASLSEQDIKDYVKSRLARFKVPRDVVFVDELPRNPTGKVVKRLLDAE
jgi:fatty-acyl-CoA synthase